MRSGASLERPWSVPGTSWSVPGTSLERPWACNEQRASGAQRSSDAQQSDNALRPPLDNTPMPLLMTYPLLRLPGGWGRL